MKNIRPLLSVLVTATVALTGATAWADTAAGIQTYATNSAVAYDGVAGGNGGGGPYPIVTAVLSVPGTVDGYTYNNWAYLAADPTGSLDMFYASSLTTGSIWTGLGGTPGYAPAVGDQISVVGNYSPFDGIPEVANSAGNPIAVTLGSQGNSPYYASPVLTTIPTINVGTNIHGINGAVQNGRGLAGAYLQLNNVTIGATGNWPTHATMSTTISDGANSMIMFFWASSYSTIAALGGTAIPQGPVDMTGFVDDFYATSLGGSYAEFVPITITAVPEPAAMGLCGLGAAVAWVCYRLRKKA
jgi:hypothetical protein